MKKLNQSRKGAGPRPHRCVGISPLLQGPCFSPPAVSTCNRPQEAGKTKGSGELEASFPRSTQVRTEQRRAASSWLPKPPNVEIQGSLLEFNESMLPLLQMKKLRPRKKMSRIQGHQTRRDRPDSRRARTKAQSMSSGQQAEERSWRVWPPGQSSGKSLDWKGLSATWLVP